jgi:hypothetical protein
MTFPEENNLEVWKQIPGFEDYSVSTWGRVRRETPGINTYAGKILKPGKARNYLYVIIYSSGKTKRFTIHRLVAENFLPNPDDKPQVDHIDNNKENNNVVNLKWATALENTGRSWKEGSHEKLKGSGNGNSKLTEKQVLEIKVLLEHGILMDKQIAKIYNVGAPRISKIKNGMNWKHLIPPTES